MSLLDTTADSTLDVFTRLATRLTGMPHGLISLVDAERQWHLSSVGAFAQGTEVPRAHSFCAHALLDEELMEVEDASVDERFNTNPLVTGPPGILHYLGAPLVMPGGEAVGALCVIDSKPGKASQGERDALSGLAKLLVAFLVLRERDLGSRFEVKSLRHDLAHLLDALDDEVRTAIDGVLGLTRLLGRYPLPDRQAGYLRMATDSTDMLRGLIQGLLDYHRNKHPARAKRESVDIQALFAELSRKYAQRAEDKGLRFQQSIAPEVPRWLLTDSVLLRQIVDTLLSNSWRFTRSGGFGLHAYLPEQEPRTTLAISVEDTGLGISDELMRVLFTQASEPEGPGYHGKRFAATEVGLALVKRLALMLGGDIVAKSEVGTGTTLTLLLPLEIANPFVESTPPALPARRAPNDLQARILAADADAVGLVVLQGLLRSLGYSRVVATESAVLALEMCERHPFDLVIIGCDMPEMGGAELLSALRARGIDLPVIGVADGSRSGTVQTYLDAGLVACLRKPFDLDALEAAVSTALLT